MKDKIFDCCQKVFKCFRKQDSSPKQKYKDDLKIMEAMGDLQQKIVYKGDQKYIYIETLESNDTIQIYLCKSRYDNSKKIKKILKKFPSQTINLYYQYYRRLNKYHHPNMIKYEDVYLEKDKLIIITEYIEGNSLKKIMETKKVIQESEESKLIQEKRILKFYTQIQSLLKYLQGKKIVHGNISPSHIIINQNEKPILIQFTPLDHSIKKCNLMGNIDESHIRMNETYNSIPFQFTCPSLKQEIPYKIPQKLLKSQYLNNDRWSLAMILIELYFNKKITQLIKNPDDPFKYLEIVIKSIKNEQIKDILKELVFLQKKIKQEPEQIVMIKKQSFINKQIKIRQTIIQSNKKHQFTSQIYSNQTNQQIKIQDSTNFTESFIDLVDTQSQVASRVIYDAFQRCNQFIDPIQSKEVEQKLKSQNRTQPHPLLILGAVLRKNNKTVYYSKKSTPLSIMSFILLSMQIGIQERKIKSIVNYEISEKQFNDAKLADKIKKQNYQHPQKTLQYEIIQFNNFINRLYYCPQIKTTSKNLRGGGETVKETYAYPAMPVSILSPSDLDSRGNINFVNGHVAEMQMRGGLPYFQPNGWVRHGLNVSQFTKSDHNDKWLRMDGNDEEWAVFFHGLRNRTSIDQVKKDVNSMIHTGFKAGSGQDHKNQKLFIPKDLYNRLKNNPKALDQYKKEKEVGRGIYGSPLINQVCLRFTTGIQFGSQQYMLAFQCRINPEKVYMSDNLKSYWIVRDPKYIRPYGLLVGKVQDIQKQKNITNQFSKKYRQFQKTAVSI